MTAKNGLPCKKCGGQEWGKDSHCLPCQRAYMLQWRKNNLAKCQEYAKEWRTNNPGRMRELRKKWKLSNREKVLEERRRWRSGRGDKEIEAQRNREKVWKQLNPDKRRAQGHRRRTQKTKAGGSYTAAEWQTLCNHYGNKCLRCNRTDVKLTFDHVIPVSKGGTSDISNGQPLCFSCNSIKGDRHIDYRPDAGPVRWIQCKIFG